MGDQFELVIIDEFQDTDAAQWDIFSLLFLNGPKKVPIIVVGDAKQAIYSFRGGDVSVMQRIQRIIESDDSMMSSSLTVNYRSHSGLLNQLNKFYSPEGVSHEFISPSEDLSGIYYEQVISPSHLNDGKGLLALRDLRKVSLNGDNKEALIKDVVLEIQRLTSGVLSTAESNKVDENWSYSDIAVLCRTKRFLQDLQYELGRHHIPYVVPRTISVFSSIAASQVRWLLWALDNPSDLRRWRSLGASWFFNLLTSPDGPNELVSAISKKGFSELQRSVMSKELLTSILSYPGGQRNITDIEHIFAVIADEFPSFNGLSEILQWVENAITDAVAQNDEVDGQRRIESDENAVRLMTMHASKGLEFPVVLLPNLETTGQDPLICTDNHEYGRTIDSTSVLLDSTGRKELSARSLFQESDRLIYVALTRATNVVIGWLNDDMSPLRTPAWLSLAEPWADKRFEGGPLVVKVMQEELASAEIRFGALNNEHLKNASVIEQKRSIREPYRRWSYSNIHLHLDNLSVEVQDSPSSSEDDDSSILEVQRGRRGFYTFGNRRGAILGNALHDSFEDVIGKIDCNDEDAISRTIMKHFQHYGFVESHDVVPVFQRLLNRSLGAAWGNQTLNSYKDATQKTSSEMRFTIPLTRGESYSEADVLVELAQLVVDNDPDGPFESYFESLLTQSSKLRLSQGFLSGSIDLVAPTLEGERKYMILDYKSNGLTSTNDFSYDSLSVEMASSGYPLQALIYSVALHRHLTARFPDYEPHSHLGGATYYYLRGAGLSDAQEGEGVFHWSIPPELTKKASSCLRGDLI
jgi:exodeoxyribonuclease V beta subunit